MGFRKNGYLGMFGVNTFLDCVQPSHHNMPYHHSSEKGLCSVSILDMTLVLIHKSLYKSMPRTS